MTPNLQNFNKDELEAPDWLNNVEFFTKVLQNSANNQNIKVLSYKLSPATVKGDHYASVMFRAKVDYMQAAENKIKSLIIKTMPEYEGQKKEILQESKVFETEIGMYTEILPKIESMLRTIGDDTVLGPTCLYHSLKPKKCIIFEDIVPHGYEVIRGRNLTMAEVQAAYKKLAKMHAISYKLIQEEPAIFDKYKEGIMSMPNIMENEFMKSGIELFIEKINTIPSLKKFSPYFEEMKANLLLNCRATFQEYRENPLHAAHYVLCHGDFHAKNMMFKHNAASKQVEDVLLFDYQLSYVGPIVNDLIYSFYMLLNEELRGKFDDILEFYFQHFLVVLKKIGFKGEQPKLCELQQQRMRHKSFEMFLLVTFLPMWYDMNSGNAELDEMMKSNDYRRSLYNHDLYLKELEVLLPKYLELGFLNN